MTGDTKLKLMLTRALYPYKNENCGKVLAFLKEIMAGSTVSSDIFWFVAPGGQATCVFIIVLACPVCAMHGKRRDARALPSGPGASQSCKATPHTEAS